MFKKVAPSNPKGRGNDDDEKVLLGDAMGDAVILRITAGCGWARGAWVLAKLDHTSNQVMINNKKLRTSNEVRRKITQQFS